MMRGIIMVHLYNQPILHPISGMHVAKISAVNIGKKVHQQSTLQSITCRYWCYSDNIAHPYSQGVFFKSSLGQWLT